MHLAEEPMHNAVTMTRPSPPLRSRRNSVPKMFDDAAVRENKETILVTVVFCVQISGFNPNSLNAGPLFLSTLAAVVHRHHRCTH